MKRRANSPPSESADLREQIKLAYQEAGVPLGAERLGKLRSLSEEKLGRLLNALNEMGRIHKEDLVAAADDACQSYLNEQAIAAIKEKAGETVSNRSA